MYEIVIVYMLLSLLYYMQRRFVLLRKNEVFVFSTHVPNLCIRQGAAGIYSIQNTNIAHRRALTGTLQFDLETTRDTIDSCSVRFSLHVKARVTHLDPDKYAGDPVQKSVAELAQAIGEYVQRCELPHFYMLFVKHTPILSENKKYCPTTNVHSLRVTITEVAIDTEQPAEEHDFYTAEQSTLLPNDPTLREAYVRTHSNIIPTNIAQSTMTHNLENNDNSIEDVI